MSNDGKALESRIAHEGDTVARLGSLGRAGVIGPVDRFGGLSEAAQVGTDHSVTCGQLRSDAAPRGVGARMAVEEEDGRPAAAMANPQRRFGQFDPLQAESFKHGPSQGAGVGSALEVRTGFRDAEFRPKNRAGVPSGGRVIRHEPGNSGFGATRRVSDRLVGWCSCSADRPPPTCVREERGTR
jgi:hypothetical protein